VKNNFIYLHQTIAIHNMLILQATIALIVFAKFRTLLYFFPFSILANLIGWFNYEFTSMWVGLFYRRHEELNDFGIIETRTPQSNNSRSMHQDYKECTAEMIRCSSSKSMSGCAK